MASRSTRKTWETAFLLSASMSSSYQETFDKAQNIMRELGAENVNLGDEAERAAQRQENAFNLMASALAEAGLYEMLGRIKDAYSDIIQVTEEFEYTMSAVGAISSAGAGDMAELEAKARELGETTVFTAQQSAEAMTFMAQAGWDTVEMLEGMDGVISLAAASGTDLAETSSIVADTLAGFGMAADETGRLADVLAQTASHTNTNVSLLGETFSNAAAVAGALGFEVEDVSVMLGLMANAGVKGSRAGTTLRNIFNGLAKDVTLTAEAFGEVDFSMFDEEGNSKNLIEVVRELRTYFDQMTDREKYLNASALAGMRGYNGLLAIIGATDEQFEELYEDIQNADGAAKRMADRRLDNLKGDVTLLNSAFESLKITIGEELTPAGRGLTQWLTEVVTGANALIEAHPGIITGINAIVGALGGVLAAFTAITAVIKIKSVISMLAGLFTPGGWLVVGIGAVAGLLGALAVHFAGVRAEIAGMYKEQVDAAKELQDYAASYRESADAWRESIGAMENEAGNTEYLIERLDDLYSIQDKTLGQKQEILAIVDLLNEAVPELALAYDAEADSLNLTADAIRERARAEIEAEQMAEKQEQLKERIRQENELGQQLSEASALYESTKAAYENIFNEMYNKGRRWSRAGMTDEQVKQGIDSIVDVAEAKKAMEEAQTALINLSAANKDNRWWIDELSRQLAGEERESGQSSGGGGSVAEHEALVGQTYAGMQDELRQLLNEQNGLQIHVGTAQDRFNEAEARYKAGKEKIDEYNNAGILQPSYGTSEGADIWDEVRLEYVQAKQDLEAAKAELAENEANAAQLSDSLGMYEEAHGAVLASQSGYTVTVENNINITGSVDDDTLEELQDNIEEAVDRALKNRTGARSRLAYDGGY